MQLKVKKIAVTPIFQVMQGKLQYSLPRKTIRNFKPYYVSKLLILIMEVVIRLTRTRIPGMASTWLGEKPLALKIRWTTIAPTTAVIKVVHTRKASRYLREELGENSNMKL